MPCKVVSRPYEHLLAPRLLISWRRKLKLESRDVAAELGIDTGTYCAFEKGRKRPGIDLGMRIQIHTRGRVRLTHWADPHKMGAIGAYQ